MDENTVKEVLTGALSKVLNALQNAPGTGNSSQSSQRDEPSTSRSTSGRSGPTASSDSPHDSDNDFEEERGKKKRYLPSENSMQYNVIPIA